MIVSESEAKTMWCPHARDAGHPDMTIWNRADKLLKRVFGDGKDHRTLGCNCIGTACMAWRIEGMAGTSFLVEPEKAKALTSRWPGVYRTIDVGPTLAPSARVERIEDVGYCGFAGKPEPA